MKTYIGAGLIAFLSGWFASAAATERMVRAQVDYEWARMLENGMVGPTETTHPLRG